MAKPASTRKPVELSAAVDRSVLIAVDPAPARVLAGAVRADGSQLLVAADDRHLLRLVQDERPSVVVMQRDFAGTDALELCRVIRSLEGFDADNPVLVVVAASQQEMDVEAGVGAGVTDWLLWPFKETYARTRMHCWVLREACRWSAAPLPDGEERRLDALRALGVLDTLPEERFDRYTRIAAGLFDVPIALVSLVDRDRQWFKSRHGYGVAETSRETAFCAHTILDGVVLQIPDALHDARFADNPVVAGPPRIRFYAGAPLAAPDGSRVGSLCLIDDRPRQLDERQLVLLRDLADLVEAELAAGAPESAPGFAAPRRRTPGDD